MLRLNGLLAVTFLLASPGFAQVRKGTPSCLHFAVRESGSESWGIWPEDARKWWAKEAQDKFPELCEASPGNAEFVLEWQREWKWKTQMHSAIGTQTYPPQVDWVCLSGPNGEEQCRPVPHLPSFDELNRELVA